jgi:hypothetical protein
MRRGRARTGAAVVAATVAAVVGVAMAVVAATAAVAVTATNVKNPASLSSARRAGMPRLMSASPCPEARL